MMNAEELQELHRVVPAEELISGTSEHGLLRIQASRFRKIDVAYQILEGYPLRAPHVVVESATLASSTVEKINEKLQADATETASAGNASVLQIWKSAKNLLTGNLLLVAREEVIQIKGLLTDRDSIKLTEAKGRVSLTVKGGANDEVVFLLNIPRDYPWDPVATKCVSSTFSDDVTEMFFGHATEIARRCSEGISPEVSLMEVDREANFKPCSPEKNDPVKSKGSPIEIATISQMKHDMKFLQKLSAIKEMVDTDNTRQNRRYKKYVEKKEIESDKQSDAQQKPDDGNGSKPKPFLSVWPIAHYLVSRFIRYLPSASCEHCRKTLLTKGGVSPDRALCGHWFHRECLDTLMTNPPFGESCPGCSKRLYHHRYKTDQKALEQRWATSQARQREMEDVANFMDL